MSLFQMKLIINADDFGISENVNNTILMMHKRGIVKSTSIVAAGESFTHAVEIAGNNPNLGIGVHLCLDGPFNIGQDYHSILNHNTKQFYNSTEIVKRLKRFSIDASEVFREYCLQIEKVSDHHIQISHLDSHHHMHVYLPFLKSMIKAAKKFKIPYIRTQRVLLQEGQSFVNYIYRCCHQIYLKSRIRTIDGLYEHHINETSDYERNYNRIFRLLATENSIIEIIIHPRDMEDPETRFFSSKRLLDLFGKQNLINYHDLN
jgi:predicted glycoside hydrolase/deacetylase ChbG (UPF0249 family)